MNKTLVVLFLSLAACGDNVVSELDAAPAIDAPPDAFDGFAWSDAEDVWSDAWCGYYERCRPEQFVAKYGDHATCVAEVTTLNCTSVYRTSACYDPYPDDRRDDLAQCHAEMTVITCTAIDAPDACYRAFE